MADRVVSVVVRAQVDGAVAAFQKVKGSIDDVTKAAAPSKADAFKKLANTAAIAGAGIVTAMGLAVKRFADFDEAMSAVAANSGATGTELESLRAIALKLGADTQFSATEAAQGVNELAKAGVSAGDVLGGGLKGALDLAAAGQVSVAFAAETAATAMTQFRLSGSQVPHIADLMANAANKAQGGVADMAQAFKQAGLVASATGLTIEETTAGLTAFAAAGLIGSDAGTSFKTMLQRLSAPTGKAAELMDELGISAYDSTGQFVGLAAVAGQLRSGMEDLTPAQRNAAMATIFGSDAVRAANILYAEGAEGIAKWTDEVSEQGAAAKMAAQLTDNLKGDIERLGGALDSVFISTGSGANGALRSLVQGLTSVVDVVGKIPGPVLLVGGALTSVALLVPKGILMWREYTAQLAAVGLSTSKLATQFPRMTAALQGVAAGAGRAVAGLTAIGFAMTAMELGPKLSETSLGANKLTLELTKGGNAAEAWGAAMSNALGTSVPAMDSFNNALGIMFDPSIMERADNMAASVLSFFGILDNTSSISVATQQFQDLDAALAGMVGSGNSDRAAEAFAQIAAAAKNQGVGLDELKAKFPQYAEALAGAEVQAKNAADGQGELADATTEAGDAAADAAGDFMDYVDALQAAGLVILNSRAAQRDFRAAVDDVSAALAKNGTTLDINTAAGRANQAALDDMATKAIALGKAIYEETGSEEKMQASLVKSRAELSAAAEKFMGSKSAADAYAESVVKIPDVKNTKINIDVAQAMSALAGVQARLYEIRDKHITLTVGTVQVGGVQTNAGLFADGGYTGDGAKHAFAGVVHRGEFVSTKETTAKNRGLLEWMHSGRSPESYYGVPGYANGGFVGGGHSSVPAPISSQVRLSSADIRLIAAAVREGAEAGSARGMTGIARAVGGY